MREQQPILEHDADASVLGRDVDAVVRIVEDAAVERDPAEVRWRRPAIAPTSVDLPAPLGPRSATVPGPAVNAASTANPPAWTRTSTSRVIAPATDPAWRPARRRRPPPAGSEITMAAPGSVCRASKTASGSVCVRPWRLPANVIVAPNSPSARAHASTAPATMRPQQRQHHVAHAEAGEAPSVAAASSYRSSIDRSAGLDGEDDERHRHERGGDDRAGRAERELDAGLVERACPRGRAARARPAARCRPRPAAAPAAGSRRRAARSAPGTARARGSSRAARPAPPR